MRAGCLARLTWPKLCTPRAYAHRIAGFPWAPPGGWQAYFILWRVPQPSSPQKADFAHWLAMGAQPSVVIWKLTGFSGGEAISRQSKQIRDNLQASAGQSHC